MEDEKYIKKFEKLKPALTKYVKSMLNLLEAKKSNIKVIINRISDFKNFPYLTEIFLPEELDKLFQTEKEIPDLISELQEMEEFLKQYKENFNLLPSCSVRFNSVSRRIGSALELIIEYGNVICGQVKWH